MPIVKRLDDMHKKYELKYDGTNVTNRLTAVEELKNARFEAASSVIYNVVETVRDILSEEGVPTGLWAKYIAFGEIVAKLTFSHKGLTLQKEISGVKSYFQTAYNADPAILDRIVEAVLGVVPPY
ncbi:hypothetical protein DRN86_04915 [Candidatus Geothermarchaeota archaeon]|nr:MAG: hypothetical protein DRN86_04915 [Candidatus Geothermarchaeota archaeon]